MKHYDTKRDEGRVDRRDIQAIVKLVKAREGI